MNEESRGAELADDELSNVHKERRRLFTTDASGYADGRPGYPAAVFEILRSVCGLGPDVAVLEIGPGTGQATGEMLAAGARVTAVEYGAELAAHLVERMHSDHLRVILGPFEDVEPPDDRFDLVASATAFHWVPTERGLERCAELLRPGGWLALWWTVWGDPTRPDPFHERLSGVLDEFAPELKQVDDQALPHGLDVEARTAEIVANGSFGPVHHERIEWTGRHTTDEMRALFGSMSPWLALPVDRRERLLDAMCEMAERDFGGRVERPYISPMYLAQRR